MKIQIDVKGDEKARADIETLAHRARNIKPILSRVGGVLREGMQRNFASQGSHFGSPWPPLSEATVARKGSSEPLVDTGALRSSLGAKTSITMTQVKTGTSDFKARFHQGGASEGRKGVLPARPVVGIAPQDRRRAISLLENYLTRGL